MTAQDAVAAPGRHFGGRLAERVADRESQVVLGLDPDPARLWPGSGDAVPAAGSPTERAGHAVAAHCRAVIQAVAPAVVAIKPQLACFERLGAPGRLALQVACDAAHDAGLLVLADGKRGDIDVSATAYAQSLVGSTPTPYGEVPGLGADALTAAPYMGVDTIMALRDVARPAGAGIFVLVRTSNPGAADVEDVQLAHGGALWEHVARIVDDLGGDDEDGLADIGAVVGATRPEHVARMRELMPRAVFLLPGVGAQGGRVEDLAPAWAPGPAAGLVTASRSIVEAAGRGVPGSPPDAARAEAERLRAAAWALA